MAGAGLAVAIALSATAADWRQFRGSDGTSVTDAQLPTAWSPEEGTNVAWKSPLVGKGVSGPIVVGNRVIVTADSGIRRDRLHVLCFDAASGERLWERQFWATGRTFCHPVSAVAANTPASDGERIFAFYSSNDLACLDLEGNLLWFRGLAHDYPLAGNDVGMSSSPVVSGDTVIVQVENQGDSFAAGLDTVTGETRWRLPRQRGANWASPTIVPGGADEGDIVLLQSPDALTAHNPRTGEQLWAHVIPCGIIPSATVVEETIYLPAGGLTALKVDRAAGGAEVLWQEARLGPGASSPVVHDGRVFILNGSLLECSSAADGKKAWDLRLPGFERVWATPLLAGGHLYCADQGGRVLVVQLPETEKGKGEVVSEIDFGESILASPAADSSGLYFRSDAHLWKIAEGE
jgi:outer membrane protein assembly factor BamB